MRLCVLGSGSVGRSLAEGFARAGNDVVLASRNPTDPDLRAWAGHVGVTTAVPAEAAASADVVLNATPGDATVEVIRSAAVPDGTVVLDVSNPLDFSGPAPTVFTGLDDSVAERVQHAFPAVRVVKSLCTVNNVVMVNPGMLDEPTTMFMAGDDAAAKATVAELLRSVGWTEILDLGGIAAAREMERNILFWLKVWGAVGTVEFNVRVVRS